MWIRTTNGSERRSLRGKERQRNSPVDRFDISPKVRSTCDKIHPLPPRRQKLYIACGDFFILFLKITTALIPLLLLFPKKLTLFGDPRYLFYFLYKQRGFEPLMGANAEACEARSDRETVRWTVSTLVQRCEAPATKSTLFHHVVRSYISLVAIFLYYF